MSRSYENKKSPNDNDASLDFLFLKDPKDALLALVNPREMYFRELEQAVAMLESLAKKESTSRWKSDGELQDSFSDSVAKISDTVRDEKGTTDSIGIVCDKIKAVSNAGLKKLNDIVSEYKLTDDTDSYKKYYMIYKQCLEITRDIKITPEKIIHERIINNLIFERAWESKEVFDKFSKFISENFDAIYTLIKNSPLSEKTVSFLLSQYCISSRDKDNILQKKLEYMRYHFPAIQEALIDNKNNYTSFFGLIPDGILEIQNIIDKVRRYQTDASQGYKEISDILSTKKESSYLRSASTQQVYDILIAVFQVWAKPEKSSETKHTK